MEKNQLSKTIKSYTKAAAKAYLSTNNDENTLGEIGEDFTEYKLNLLKLFGTEGHILRNIYIPKDNCETTEIDLIFLTSKALFVIESKNYSGWIFGGKDDPYWTSVLPNKEKVRFFNPIKQNESHIKWLKNYLGIDDLMILSMIVFSNRCNLKKVPDDVPKTAVVKRDEVNTEIKKVLPKLKETLSQEQVIEIKNKLENLTSVDESVKAQHVETVKSKFSNEAIICPWCNGKLVKRIAKKGNNVGKEFLGCSNYPKCKYSKY